MTKEEMKAYADRYRKVQGNLTIVLSVFIFLVCAVLLFISVFVYMAFDGNYIWIVIGAILDLLGIGDTFLGVYFLKSSRKRFAKISDKEAAVHYCRIHGFDSRITPSVKKEEENK